MSWRFDFTCACGEHWAGSVPKKFRDKKYFLSAWKKKHGEHISKTVWPK